MMEVYVCVDDVTKQVLGVYREMPQDEMAGVTCYHEEYTGPANWNNTETPVYRDGVGDYRTVDLSGVE